MVGANDLPASDSLRRKYCKIQGSRGGAGCKVTSPCGGDFKEAKDQKKAAHEPDFNDSMKEGVKTIWTGSGWGQQTRLGA